MIRFPTLSLPLSVIVISLATIASNSHAGLTFSSRGPCHCSRRLAGREERSATSGPLIP